MNKKTRDWLFRIFVFLFVIITFLLSLYATGYRFNLTWPLSFNHLLVKTGILALDTEPHNAIIAISSETKISNGFNLLGNKKETVTPAKIKNLLPGDYLISFSLDGYWPYEKKLKVYPEQTTFLENVILFKKSLPLNVYSATPQDIQYSPDGRYAWLSNDKIVVDLESEQKINDTEQKINWIDNAERISSGAKIINLSKGTVDDYSNTIGPIQESELNGNKLIYLNQDSVSILDINTKNTTSIKTDGKVITYKSSGDNLFLITENNSQFEIKNFDLKNNKIISSTKLLSSKDFHFSINNYNLVLSDSEHQIIYLLDSSNPKIIKDIIRGVNSFKWLDNNKISYATESEIYIYDLTQNKPYLITRLSEKISSLAWSSDNFLIYSTPTKIGTINLTHEGNDITVLWQSDNISSLSFNNRTDILYFSASIGQQSGLYKMSLK
jgi:hypothetical protein